MGSAEEGNSALSMSARPMRDLILLLPRLEVRNSLEIDYAGSDAAVLLQVCANAEVTMSTLMHGLSSIGMLLANCTPEIETGEIAPNAIEAIGWCTAELAEVAAVCNVIAAAGRRHLANYKPDTTRVVEGAKP
jgi:hypothetical protein